MKKILIVDDSEVNLYLFQAFFEKDENIRVDIESNGLNALSLLKEGVYDLVVLDLMMPHIDGFQILRELKGDPELKKIPVLVVSARQDMEAYKQAMDLGVQGYIKKPIMMEDIYSKVHSVFAM